MLIFTNLVLLPVPLSDVGVSEGGAARALEAESDERRERGFNRLFGVLAHFVEKRRAMTAVVASAANIVVKKAWVQMLLVHAAVTGRCFINFRSWQAVVVAVVRLVITAALCEALMVALGIGAKVAAQPMIALGVPAARG